MISILYYIINDSSRIINDGPRSVIYDFRVMLQLEASLTDDSRSIISDCNMFIVQATGELLQLKPVLLFPFVLGLGLPLAAQPAALRHSAQ